MGNKYLLISMAYPPDKTSAGQHYDDLCNYLIDRGHTVIVLTAREDYSENKSYPIWSKEKNKLVIRLPFSNVSKKNIAARLIGSLSFILQGLFICLLMGKINKIICTTTTPLTPLIGLWMKLIKRVPYIYWLMDLNPDQMVSLGKIKENGIIHRLSAKLQSKFVDSAEFTVVMDDYMKRRVQSYSKTANLIVIEPWPVFSSNETSLPDSNPYFSRWDINDKVVVMYSGNHGITSKVDKFLNIIESVRNPIVEFVFVGGGVLFDKVEHFARLNKNVKAFPYVPKEDLHYSLAVADMHLVTIDERMIGINHPCKIYGVMEASRPVLFWGSKESNGGNLVVENNLGWQFDVDDEARIVEFLNNIQIKDRHTYQQMGVTGSRLVNQRFSRAALVAKLSGYIEQ